MLGIMRSDFKFDGKKIHFKYDILTILKDAQKIYFLENYHKIEDLEEL